MYIDECVLCGGGDGGGGGSVHAYFCLVDSVCYTLMEGE